MNLPEDTVTDEIDLAPLIDCVFLLLIFFLVATQLSEFEEQLEFDIPRSEANLQVTKQFEMIPIRLDDNEIVQIKSNQINTRRGLRDQQLKDSVKTLADTYGLETELFINIHPEAEFGSVIYLVDLFKLMGFQNIELRTYGISGDFKEKYRELERLRSEAVQEALRNN